MFGMKHSFIMGLSFGLGVIVSANAFTLTGKVSDESGKAVEKAAVSLVAKGLNAVTDANGEFKIHQDEANDPATNPTTDPSANPTTDPSQPSDPGIAAIRGNAPVGYVNVNNGILSYSQSVNQPVRVQVFDMVGNRLLNETLYGSGAVDMQSSMKAQGTYFARVSVGNAQKNFKFTSNGKFGVALGETVGASKVLMKAGESDDLRVVAEGFDTLTVKINNLIDTTLALTLKKKPAAEPEYAFGWGLKNDPVPTRGCGKAAPGNIPKSGSWDFQWSKGKRTVRIDIPDNYDNNKPYRLIFGMHCMGGWAGGVQQEGYHGLKYLDTEKTSIFIAPEGNGNQAPWGQDDYTLFDELLAFMESNYCIDSSRVFSMGFSYGSMFSNGLSRNHQDVLRAVAVFETAEVNIWLPQHTGKPIAWMGVLGLQDDLCRPEMGRAARNTALKYASAEGKDATKEQAQEYGGNGPHVCYDYKDVDPRFPVRWCTQNGGHIWDHKDPGQNQSWVPATTWDFFTQF